MAGMVIPQSLLRDFRKSTGNKLSPTGRRDLTYIMKSGTRGKLNLASVALMPVIHEVHQYGTRTDAVFAESLLHGVALGLGMSKKEAAKKPCPHCGQIHDDDDGKMPPFIKKLLEMLEKME